MKFENDKVQSILTCAQGNSLDILYTVYEEYILPSDFPVDVFRAILEYPDLIGDLEDQNSVRVSNARVQELQEDYYSYLRELVLVLVKKNLPENDFYTLLYDRVFSSSGVIFPSDKEAKVILLYFLCVSIMEVPYYQAVDLLDMSDGEYQKTVKAIRPALQQAIHMLNRKFKHRTEELSQITRIANQLQDNQAQIVYWSVVFNLIQENAFKNGCQAAESGKTGKKI